MNDVFFNIIIEDLLRQNRVSEVLAMRLWNSKFDEQIRQKLTRNMGARLGTVISWPLLKLLTILRSRETLHRAGGVLFFGGKEQIAAELVHVWLRMDFLKDTRGQLLVWSPEKALWLRTEGCGFRAALRMLLEHQTFVSNDQHKKKLLKFFGRFDGSDKFEKHFNATCKVEDQLCRQSHLLPIKNKAILDLKERKIRPRCRNDYCTFEVSIELETAERALASRCIDSLLADEQESGVRRSGLSHSFETFLSQLTCGNAHLKYHLQRMIGSFFAGDIGAKKLMCFWLGGANSGKSTLGEILLDCFLDLMNIITEKAVLGNKGATHDTELLDCAGLAPLLYLDECDTNYKLNRAQVNRLLGARVVKGRVACSPTMQKVELKKNILLLVNHLPDTMDADTQAKCQIIPFRAEYVAQSTQVDEANFRYKAHSSWKANFLADKENKQSVFLYVLVGALDYWLDQDSLLSKAPGIVAQAARVQYGKAEAAQPRKHASFVTEFADKYLELPQEPAFDDFTPTEELYKEFKHHYEDSCSISLIEFGKTLKGTLGSKYHHKNGKWVQESGTRKQVRGYRVTIKQDSADDIPATYKRQKIGDSPTSSGQLTANAPVTKTL